MVSAIQGKRESEREDEGGWCGRASTNPAMFPEDDSLPPNNAEMLFMAALLIGAGLRFSAELRGCSLPLAVH